MAHRPSAEPPNDHTAERWSTPAATCANVAASRGEALVPHASDHQRGGSGHIGKLLGGLQPTTVSVLMQGSLASPLALSVTCSVYSPATETSVHAVPVVNPL